MGARRAIYIVSLVLAAAFLALFIFLSALSAQPPGPPGAGGPPGMGGGGGGGPLSWSETPPDKLVAKTYDEYLMERGTPRQPLPGALLVDDKGQPIKRSPDGWAQLEKLYAKGAEVEIKPALTPGRVGSSISSQWRKQLGVIMNENKAIVRAVGAAENGFEFEVGAPTWDPRSVTSAGGTIRVGVIMRPKKSFQQNYGATIYRLLKPFDNFGDDRTRFTFVTYQGGYFNPPTVMLHPSSVALWDALWATPQVVLALQDAKGNAITTGSQNAGLTGNAPALIAYPPEIRRTPAFAYLMPEADKRFSGGRMSLDYAKGWYYEFQFQLTMEDLTRVDRAKAGIVMPPAKLMSEAAAKAQTPEEISPAVLAAANGWIAQQVSGFGFAKPPAGAAAPGSPGEFTPGGGVSGMIPGGAGGGYQLAPPVTAGTGIPL